MKKLFVKFLLKLAFVAGVLYMYIRTCNIVKDFPLLLKALGGTTIIADLAYFYVITGLPINREKIKEAVHDLYRWRY